VAWDAVAPHLSEIPGWPEVLIIAFGVLLGPVFLVVGGVIFVIGIATWLIDDARAYANAPEPTDGAHH